MVSPGVVERLNFLFCNVHLAKFMPVFFSAISTQVTLSQGKFRHIAGIVRISCPILVIFWRPDASRIAMVQ
jgi:hypothetical protein